MVRKRVAAGSNGVTKALRSREKATTDTRSPPAPRYNTRSVQAKAAANLQAAELQKALPFPLGDEDEDVEDILRTAQYPKYKDDLPNAFNGEVDPSKDYISKVPCEVIDNIISFLLLDHDPERGVKDQARGHRNYGIQPHALLSVAAMSRLFYHATESYAKRLTIKHPYLSSRLRLPQPRLEHGKGLRRSGRIANITQPERREIYRVQIVRELQYACVFCFRWSTEPAKLANAVCICRACEEKEFGDLMVRFHIIPCLILGGFTNHGYQDSHQSHEDI